MTPVVSLSGSDLWIAEQIAHYRSTYDRRVGIETRKHDKSRSDTDIDLDGAIGEVAVAKLFGVIPSFGWTRVDPGFDLLVHGVRVDVKSTRHAGGRLLVRVKPDKATPDAYVLAIILGNAAVKVAGWVAHSELGKFGREMFPGTLAVDQQQLRPVGDLYLAARLREIGGGEQCQRRP